MIQQIDDLIGDLALADAIEKTLKKIALIDFFSKEKGEKSQARIENLQELVSAGDAFEVDETTPLTPLQQFINAAALDAGEGQANEHDDAIQLMTYIVQRD